MRTILSWSTFFVAVCMLSATAQPPSKEIVDPKGKPVKPIPKVDDDVPAAPAGVAPPPGVLVVAVQSLPEFMSPAYARSDSELAALDLIFEGLVRPMADMTAGRQFEPGLARELPALTPGGREFRLAPAVWADPTGATRPVTSADIRTTVEKLKVRAHQFGGEAGEEIDAVYADAEDRCRILLKRGVPDPLALMTFKILPNDRPDDEAFARQPVGSGPFIYSGRRTEGDRTYAVFSANPAYGQRAGRANLPRIQAVWMVESHDPMADFKAGRVHFVLTRATAELAGLRSTAQTNAGGARPAGRLDVTMGSGRVDTLAGRRISLLAVNHRDPLLGGSRQAADLRRLIAHAIPRDAILNSCFRAGFPDHHQPLDGPFPPNTWPCNLVAGRLDDPGLAGDLAKAYTGEPRTVELKFPSGDTAVERACQQIQQSLSEFRVTIKLAPRSPADFRKQVFVETDFQLAYWHYDFADDWFDLGGLLDPHRIGPPGQGRNFMSYIPSPDFAALLARTQSHRDFGELRSAMRQLHVEFRKEMPFIPLWHLDTHVLVSSKLRTEPTVPMLDPLAPFLFIDQWVLK